MQNTDKKSDIHVVMLIGALKYCFFSTSLSLLMLFFLSFKYFVFKTCYRFTAKLIIVILQTWSLKWNIYCKSQQLHKKCVERIFIAHLRNLRSELLVNLPNLHRCQIYIDDDRWSQGFHPGLSASRTAL